MQIFVKLLTGMTVAVDVVPTNTVLEVKQKVVHQHHVPAAEQRLIYAGNDMEDAKTLAEYDVHNETTLYMIECVKSEILQLQVKASNLDTIYVQVSKTLKVQELKQQIREKNPIEEGNHKLFFGQHKINDGLTLEEAMVPNGTRLTLVVGTKGGY